MDLTSAIRRYNDHGRVRCSERAEFGDGYLVIGEKFQQEALELLIGPIKFVDQQDGRTISRLVDGFQQGALNQELRVEQIEIRRPIALAAGFHQADFQKLPSVIPLVHRMVDIQSLVTLEADQVGMKAGSQCAGDFGLPDAGLSLQEQRSLKFQSQKNRDGQASVGDVSLVAQ